MITAGLMDDRMKGIMDDRMKGLGFGLGGETEEGELVDSDACFGMEKDVCIDPDLDFSYIDVKIQDVLGDFQKDFEGGVFTENLGAKYGGYGSFLPAYKRLPQTRSTPKTPGRTIVPSTRGSSYEGTCNGLSNQMKVSSTSSFKNSNLGGSSKVCASTSAITTKNHTKDHNVINKVGTMPTKKKNFHARDVTTEHKSERLKSRKESSHNYSEELQREVGRPDLMVTPLITKNGAKNIKTGMKKSSMKSLDRKSGAWSSEEPVEAFMDGPICEQPSSDVAAATLDHASTSATTTKNHTKDHNVINKVGTMPAKKKNFHARDVTTEHKSKRLKSRKESSHNYSEELQREVGRPDLMVTPLIAKNGAKNIKTGMKKSSKKSLDRKSGTSSSEEPVEAFMDAPICDQPSSDVAAATLDHALVNNWACCDICEKWRLLPNGMNPEALPNKWECCMQYWLPAAMNSCIISEAETTDFMNLHYHASLPEDNSNHDRSAPSTCSVALRVNQMSREVVSRCDVDCSQVRRPNYISSERQKLKFKLKGKNLQYCSDGVDIISGVGKGLELMSNELFHPDIPVEKKIKTDLPTKVSPPHLANGTSTANSVGKKMGKIGDEFLNNSTHEMKGSCSSLNGTMKERLEFHSRKKLKHADVIDTRMSDKPVFPVKKRKAREWHDTQSNQETAMRSHHLGEKKAKLGEEYIGSNVRKENRDNAPNIKKTNCVLGEKKAQAVPHSPSQVSHVISSAKANGLECVTGETYDNLANLDKLTKESEDKNVAHHGSSEHKEVNELDMLCPMRKCQPSSAALMAMKEARELKHAADRMKNVEQELESATIYFQAALKFLQAASLSEPSSVVNMKYEELNESLKIYTETAAFCEFCALEYDRRKEMAFSALAYKCVEVAYFKVAFLKSHFASKDHQELQETIHAFWPGNSPSSSTSDLVSLNYPGALEKITCAKVDSSPQITDSHAIASRHSLYRWLDYAQVSVSALEASRKSQNALAVASASLGKNGCDSIASLKETLNFDFHNVEELLRRIRASMEFFYH